MRAARRLTTATLALAAVVVPAGALAEGQAPPPVAPVAAPPTAAAPPPGPGAPVAVRYASLVAGAAAALADCTSSQCPGVPAALDDLAAARSLSASLRGRAAPATADPLEPAAEELQRQPPDVAQARTRLEGAAAALALPPGSAAPEGSAARDALEDVYRSDAFRDLDRPPSHSLFGDLLAALGRALRAVLGLLGHTGSLALAAAVLAAAVAIAVLRLRGGSAARSRRAPAEPAGAGDDPEAEWGAAFAAAAAGDHREAVRRAFRSALLSVAVRGRLPVQATWTTRELLARAAGDADLVAALAPAADAFDGAWYSGRPVDAAVWETARDRCEAVRRLARRGAPA